MAPRPIIPPILQRRTTQYSDNMIRTKIIGTGSYLPERVVSNREVGALLGIEPAIVSRLTGIQERRRAAASQASSDLAVEAARPAL